MAADHRSVKYDRKQTAVKPDYTCLGVHEPERVQSGVTARDLIAAVGNLKMPGEGFADDLEAVQAAQGIAEMPEWPD